MHGFDFERRRGGVFRAKCLRKHAISRRRCRHKQPPLTSVAGGSPDVLVAHSIASPQKHHAHSPAVFTAFDAATTVAVTTATAAAGCCRRRRRRYRLAAADGTARPSHLSLLRHGSRRSQRLSRPRQDLKRRRCRRRAALPTTPPSNATPDPGGRPETTGLLFRRLRHGPLLGDRRWRAALPTLSDRLRLENRETASATTTPSLRCHRQTPLHSAAPPAAAVVRADARRQPPLRRHTA